jgi:hypothetical protein
MNDSTLLFTAALQRQRQAIHDWPIAIALCRVKSGAGDGSRPTTTTREEESWLYWLPLRERGLNEDGEPRNRT